MLILDSDSITISKEERQVYVKVMIPNSKGEHIEFSYPLFENGYTEGKTKRLYNSLMGSYTQYIGNPSIEFCYNYMSQDCANNIDEIHGKPLAPLTLFGPSTSIQEGDLDV